MANVNKVTIIGRITRDIELRYTPKGTAVTEIAMATNRNRLDESGQRIEETTFLDITFWGKQAELANQYLSKGRELYVEGRLQLDKWEDKQTGQKRSKLRVIGENMQFIGGGGGGQQSGGNSGSNSNQSQPQAQQAPAQQPTTGGSPANVQFEDDDDIPF